MINGFTDKTIYRMGNDAKSMNIYYDTSGPFTAIGISGSKVKAAYSDTVFLGPFPNSYHIGFNNYDNSGVNGGAGTLVGIYSGNQIG